MSSSPSEERLAARETREIVRAPRDVHRRRSTTPPWWLPTQASWQSVSASVCIAPEFSNCSPLGSCRGAR